MTLSNGAMTNECWIRRCLEGSGRDLIEVLSRQLPGGTELRHGTRWPDPRFEPSATLTLALGERIPSE
jgi:hypothetical protein